ncbi:MAG: proline dehydrogenase family protein [Terriglobia bacterium]
MLSRILFPLARRFVSGHDVAEAVVAVRRLNALGITATLDVLGENVTQRKSAELAAASYLQTLEAIRQSGIQANVSLKLTQMGLDIDQDFCLANLVQICQKAAALESFVRIDMEGSSYTQKTLDLFQQLFRTHQNVGIVIQAYLHRSLEDIEQLVTLGARVRLCKGAYQEPPGVALREMPEIRRNFKKLAEILLLRGNYPALATHDDDLIRWIQSFTTDHAIGREKFELQMLYGVRAATQRKLAAEGYNLRVYVPFGTHWLPYFYRRLRERKENVYFVLKHFLKA